MRMRDIVRAKIIKDDPVLKASTKGDMSLGVLSASCTQCGELLKPSDKKIDFNVECSRCDYTAYRVLSDGFGHGHENRLRALQIESRWRTMVSGGRVQSKP